MPTYDLRRRLVAEFLGTALLVTTVIGAGIMATSLTTDHALILLGNALSTGAMLVVLVTLLQPITGAHLNPAVSLIFALSADLPAREAVLYTLAQVAGAVAGTITAHAMFAMPLLDVALTARSGSGLWLSEAIAAFGLTATILASLRLARDALPWLVGLYISAAYWFTASTSFANPAVTLARALSNTVVGIRPVDTPGFIAAQILGAVCALALMTWLLAPARNMPKPSSN
jgi:glycerol uptake facilitator-like aquaporin